MLEFNCVIGVNPMGMAMEDYGMKIIRPAEQPTNQPTNQPAETFEPKSTVKKVVKFN